MGGRAGRRAARCWSTRRPTPPSTAPRPTPTPRPPRAPPTPTRPGCSRPRAPRSARRMVHVSTDYVFPAPGDERRPLEPDDPTAPAGVYARTKLDGEQRVRAALPDAHHVVRTAWLYGGTGANFVADDGPALPRARHPRRRRRPARLADLVRGPRRRPRRPRPLVRPARHPARGGRRRDDVVRVRAGGVRRAGRRPGRVRPCDTASFPRPAPRPAWSVLSDASWRAAGLAPLPPGGTPCAPPSPGIPTSCWAERSSGVIPSVRFACPSRRVVR